MLANMYLKLVVCLAEVWDVWGPQLSGSSFDLEAEGAHTKRRLSNLLKEKKHLGQFRCSWETRCATVYVSGVNTI